MTASGSVRRSKRASRWFVASSARRAALLVAAVVAAFAVVNLAGAAGARGASTATVKVYVAHGSQQSCAGARPRSRTVAAPAACVAR